MGAKDKHLEKLEVYKRSRDRDKAARFEAEELLEDRTRQLYIANQELKEKYDQLEKFFKEQEFSIGLMNFSHKTVNFEDLLRYFISELCKVKGWPIGHIYLLKEDDSQEHVSSAIWYFEESKKYRSLYKALAFSNLKENYQLTDALVEMKTPIFLRNLDENYSFLYKDICLEMGLKGILLIPIRSYHKTICFLEFFFLKPEEVNKRDLNSFYSLVHTLESILERLKAQAIAKETNKKLRQALEELEHIAHHDYLTGLPNRRLFEIIFERDIASAKRHKQCLALFYIDVDDFKMINDTFGHPVGDEFLKKLAKRFQSLLRKEDLIARLGGDEFAILAQIDDSKDAEDIAEKLLQKIRKPYTIKSHRISASISLGIAIYPDAGESFKSLCKKADDALYEVKAVGKNTSRKKN